MKLFIRNEIRLHGKAKTYATLIGGSICCVAFVALIHFTFMAMAHFYPGA